MSDLLALTGAKTISPEPTTPDVAPRDHHGSHAGLLVRPSSLDATATVDAIVVPTARRAERMRDAMRLAKELGCVLVVLCSKLANATRTMELAAEYDLADCLVVRDFGKPAGLPSFATSAKLAGSRFDTKSDLSLKRNVGWLLARMSSWSRVMFLDDDIVNVAASDVRAAAAVLDTHGLVGLANAGFPDNSVVCHAYRLTGGTQATFVGGGALLLAPYQVESFFPDIYNEDWFFFHDYLRHGKIAVVGQAPQEPYDPFATSRRARCEEFGDTLAEGLYACLDEGQPADYLDPGFWSGVLMGRRRLIADALNRASTGTDLAGQAAIVGALRAALESNRMLSANRCVGYMRDWRADRDVWLTYADALGFVGDPAVALEKLNLRFETTRSATAGVATDAPVEPPANLPVVRVPRGRKLVNLIQSVIVRIGEAAKREGRRRTRRLTARMRRRNKVRA